MVCSGAPLSGRKILQAHADPADKDSSSTQANLPDPAVAGSKPDPVAAATSNATLPGPDANMTSHATVPGSPVNATANATMPDGAAHNATSMPEPRDGKIYMCYKKVPFVNINPGQ